MYLRTLGGDPDTVIKDYVKNVEDYQKLDFSIPDIGQKSDADNIHYAILNEIKRLYFGSLSRASAVTICNDLPDDAIINLISGIDDLEYNTTTFANDWNKFNPDDTPIKYSSEFAS